VRLDRAGIFKATPIAWALGDKSKDSQSVPVVTEFQVTACLDNGEWEDWTGYEPQTITCYTYIVNREGKVNTTGVEQLAKALGWNGDPAAFAGPVPNVVAQIVVEQETYNGTASLKVKWINPGDFVPGPKTMAGDAMQDFRKVFGAQMKATAAAVIKQNGTAAPRAAPPPPKPAPAPTAQEQSTLNPDDDLPF
jgi:hypothetical protein